MSSGSAFAPNKADRGGGDPQKPLEGTKWCRKICKKWMSRWLLLLDWNAGLA